MFELIQNIDAIFGVLGAVFALLAWLKSRATERTLEAERRKAQTPVAIELVSPEGERLELPYRPLRGQMSRAEVAGVVGMFAGGRRFTLPAMSRAFANGDFDRILRGESDTLSIPAPADEFSAFKAEVEKFKAEQA